ncbi:MAG: hypothetical protein MUC48_04960 [Leptolyngbya sp. Prado105]|jgi:hypothetical protein|nr:hypothetical protein [Leptolyngbya sp. Prado105]
MTKMIDPSDPATAQLFERVDPAIDQKASYVPSDGASTTVAANEVLNGREQDGSHTVPPADLREIDHWKPAEPQFCKDIAFYYGQSKRTIQKWFVDLREIAPWLKESELRLSDDRYSLLAVDLLGERYFAGSKKKWAEILTVRFVDRVEASQSPPILPDVLPPQQKESNNAGSNLPGLSLHIGSTLTLPPIPGLVPSGNDPSYLIKIQQRLQAFEQLQQQTIEQMQAQYQEAQDLNAQYQEAMTLNDQLLLQEFQLRGVQLGFTALHVKQQAFKSTVQAAESGSLSMPGKPEVEIDQPSSV